MLLSTFAFKFNLRRYTTAGSRAVSRRAVPAYIHRHGEGEVLGHAEGGVHGHEGEGGGDDVLQVWDTCSLLGLMVVFAVLMCAVSRGEDDRARQGQL
jgi:hypothetical protein